MCEHFTWGEWIFVARGRLVVGVWFVDGDGSGLCRVMWDLASEGHLAFAASSVGEELDLLLIFLVGIVGLVVEADMVGAKCWVLTRGPKHSVAGEMMAHDKTDGKRAQLSCQACPIQGPDERIYRATNGLGPKVRSYPWLPTNFSEYTVQLGNYTIAMA